jgi:putative transposase
MILAHKIELNPNNRQRTLLSRSAGVARFAYNWALAEWNSQYEAGEKVSEASLRRQLNSIKKVDFPWMTEVTKCAPQQAIKDLGTAFTNFFKGKSGYPKFHRRGVNDSFRADNGPARKGADAVNVRNRKVQLQKIGWIRLREMPRFIGQIKSAIVSRQADKWFVALTIEIDFNFERPAESQGSVGVDLGVKDFATLSTGEKLEGPKPHTALLRRLRNLQRSLSRKQKGSANREKAKRKVAKIHYRIWCIRQDFLHKTTTRLAQEFNDICIEDLNVKGMSSSAKGTVENPGKMVKQKSGLNRRILDQSFFEFRRQLKYKADMYGSKVTIADRFFPSSKTCSSCGENNKDLKLKHRKWTCSACGTDHDRDVNAAVNLNNLAASSAVIACGEESISASVKQEDNCKQVCS